MPSSEYSRLPLRRQDGSIRAFALVDPEDYEKLSPFSWHLQSAGYAARRVKRSGLGQMVLLHRQILGLEVGDLRCVDHINRNKLDNRRANLRVVERWENLHNVGHEQGGSSRYRGVSLNKNRRWHAYANVRGKRTTLGYFKDELEAAIAAEEFRLENMRCVAPDPRLADRAHGKEPS